MILTSQYSAIGEGAITTNFKRLAFDAAGLSEARTQDLLDAKREHCHKATATGDSVNFN
jgi:hypothetical protein